MLAHHGKSEGRSSMKMEQSCAFEAAVQKHDLKQPTFCQRNRVAISYRQSKKPNPGLDRISVLS